MMEFSALRARLMLGAASWKLKIDAYLYYAISGWAAYSQVPLAPFLATGACFCAIFLA